MSLTTAFGEGGVARVSRVSRVQRAIALRCVQLLSLACRRLHQLVHGVVAVGRAHAVPAQRTMGWAQG